MNARTFMARGFNARAEALGDARRAAAAAIDAALPCPHCGSKPTFGYSYRVTLTCDNCYDGAPDSATRNDYGDGWTESEAVAGWNAWVSERGAA